MNVYCAHELLIQHCPHCGPAWRKVATLRAARAAVCPELNQPIIETVADRIIEELKND
jgi:hypothetical protein